MDATDERQHQDAPETLATGRSNSSNSSNNSGCGIQRLRHTGEIGRTRNYTPTAQTQDHLRKSQLTVSNITMDNKAIVIITHNKTRKKALILCCCWVSNFLLFREKVFCLGA